MAVRQQFDAQQAEAVASLKNWAMTKAYKRKDAKADKKAKKELLASLILWVAANQALADAMQPILYSLMIETGSDAFLQVGKQPSQFDPLDPKIIASARAQANLAAEKINQETEKQLRAALSQGIDQEETTDELLARMGGVFGNALTTRTARITDAESWRAMGKSDVLSWQQTGVVYGKEWYAVLDERTCPWCNAEDNQIIGLDQDYYSLGDVLTVGDKTLNLNFDDIGEPPLHVGCRCVVMPVTVPLSDVT